MTDNPDLYDRFLTCLGLEVEPAEKPVTPPEVRFLVKWVPDGKDETRGRRFRTREKAEAFFEEMAVAGQHPEMWLETRELLE